MIPVTSDVLTELLPIIEDDKYRELVINQLTYLNDNKRKLIKKVHVFYNLYLKNHLSPNQKTRCCDFKVLEKNYKNFGKENGKTIKYFSLICNLVIFLI